MLFRPGVFSKIFEKKKKSKKEEIPQMQGNSHA